MKSVRENYVTEVESLYRREWSTEANLGKNTCRKLTEGKVEMEQWREGEGMGNCNNKGDGRITF